MSAGAERDSEYKVYVSGGTAPVRVLADRLDSGHGEINLFRAGVQVAVVSHVGAVVHADALAEPAGAAGFVDWRLHKYPMELEVPGELASFSSSSGSAWPAAAGLAFGFIIGAGAALSCVGVW